MEKTEPPEDTESLSGFRRLLRLAGGESRAEMFQVAPPTAIDWGRRLDTYRRDGQWDAAAIEPAFARIRPDLEGVRFVLAPGYFTDFLAIAKRVNLSDYLEAQTDALHAAGLDVTLAPVNSQASIADNAATLRRLVAHSAKPVFLISHSKGGIDSLEFLLGADDRLLAKVVGWLAIQAPFAGVPLADRVAELEIIRRPSEAILRALGGSGESLHDLCADTRADYLAAHDKAIAALAARLPILAVAAALDRKEGVKDRLSATYPGLVWMRDHGIRSDSVVPTTSAILPHAPFVLLTPVDHTAIVAGGAGALSTVERKLLTKLLVALVMDDRH